MTPPKPLGIREAYKLAGKNAAGLIESMCLDELFGDDLCVEENEDVLTQAQGRLVAFLTDKFEEPR